MSEPKDTYADFFAALERTPRDWVVIKGTRSVIRRPPGLQYTCPIVEAGGCGPGASSELTNTAARRMRLSRRQTNNLLRAADGFTHGKLRRRMLAACGLPPETEAGTMIVKSEMPVRS